MRYFLTSLLACCLLSLPAQALVLPPAPSGTCPLDSNQTPDRDAMGYLHLSTQTPVELKALFAECAELQRLRQGRSVFLTNYGAVFEQKGTVPAGTTQAQAIALLAQVAGLSGTMATESINGATLANNPTQAINENARLATPSYHGILKQTERMLILGSEQRHVGLRLQYASAAVTAITIIDGKIIAMNFYAPLSDKGVFAKLALVAESYANGLLAANPS